MNKDTYLMETNSKYRPTGDSGKKSITINKPGHELDGRTWPSMRQFCILFKEYARMGQEPGAIQATLSKFKSKQRGFERFCGFTRREIDFK